MSSGSTMSSGSSTESNGSAGAGGSGSGSGSGSGGAGGAGSCGGAGPACGFTHLWSKAWGSPLNDETTSLVLDAKGNPIIGADFQGAIDFGCGAIKAGVGAAGLILKLGTDGDCTWTKHFGDPARVTALATDAANNVYATGYSTGPIDFGGGVLPGGGGQKDPFVVKFDANGNHQWGAVFGDASDQTGLGIAVDAAGNVFATGSFQGTINFGGTALVSQGGTDIYMVKFGPKGDHLWSKAFGDANNQIGRAIAVDPTGNVLLTGTLGGTADFGGGVLMSPGLGNVFIAKFDTTGKHLWSATYGDAADQFAQTITTDPAGNVFGCGTFNGSINFGGQTLTSVGGQDAWVAKFDPAGKHLWSMRGGGPNDQSCNNVAIDGKGRIAIGGWFYGSGDLGGPPLISAGLQDGFLALYDPSGAHLWSKLYGDAAQQANKGLAFDAAGNLFLAAYQTGPIDLGGGAKVGGGGSDIFVAKLKP